MNILMIFIWYFYFCESKSSILDKASFSFTKDIILDGEEVIHQEFKSSDHYVKTGTTIVGLCCIDGVVLGADTRTTGGFMIINKHKQKIHEISKRIYCCTAGTVADCDQIVRKAIYDLSLAKIKLNLVADASTYDDKVAAVRHSITRSCQEQEKEAVFIIGGVDYCGSHLFSVDNNGFSLPTPFCSLGSGSTRAYSVLESELEKYGVNLGHSIERVNISLANATEIIRRAVCAGIQNDIGSGSHVDIVVISKHDKSLKWREELDPMTGKPVTNKNIIGKLKTERLPLIDTGYIGEKILDIDSNEMVVDFL